MCICVRVYWAGETSASHGVISHGVNVEVEKTTGFLHHVGPWDWINSLGLAASTFTGWEISLARYKYMDVTIIEMTDSVFLLLQVDPNSGHSMSKLVRLYLIYNSTKYVIITIKVKKLLSKYNWSKISTKKQNQKWYMTWAPNWNAPGKGITENLWLASFLSGNW